MTMTIAESQELMPASREGRTVLAKFFRAAGDPGRLALLAFIADGERNASECVEKLGMVQSRVSAHLACLVTCGFLSLRRDGRHAYYSIRDPRVLVLVRLGAELAAENAAAVASCVQVRK